MMIIANAVKCTVLATFLALSAAAHAQQTPNDAATKVPITTPIPGMEQASLAGSARASKLIGSAVYKGDTSIGTIDDVLVDLEHGTLGALVLSVGGFLGVGTKLVAVPVNQIKLGTEAKFTTELTKEQLTGAPAFEPSKLK